MVREMAVDLLDQGVFGTESSPSDIVQTIVISAVGCDRGVVYCEGETDGLYVSAEWTESDKFLFTGFTRKERPAPIELAIEFAEDATQSVKDACLLIVLSAVDSARAAAGEALVGLYNEGWREDAPSLSTDELSRDLVAEQIVFYAVDSYEVALQSKSDLFSGHIILATFDQGAWDVGIHG